PGIGFCQALLFTAVGRLPEYRQITVAIGLKRDVCAISGPIREALFAAKGQASGGARPRQFVDRDIDLFSVRGFKRDPLAVRRHPWKLVAAERKSHRLRTAFVIEEEKILAFRERARHVDE